MNALSGWHWPTFICPAAAGNAIAMMGVVRRAIYRYRCKPRSELDLVGRPNRTTQRTAEKDDGPRQIRNPTCFVGRPAARVRDRQVKWWFANPTSHSCISSRRSILLCTSPALLPSPSGCHTHEERVGLKGTSSSICWSSSVQLLLLGFWWLQSWSQLCWGSASPRPSPSLRRRRDDVAVGESAAPETTTQRCRPD